MTGVQYGGQKLDVKKVYYNGGVNPLANGEVLCYKQDATKRAGGTASIGPGAIATADPIQDDLGVVVVRAAAANLLYFAGIVPLSEAGRIEAGWIDIIVPKRGDILPVLVIGATDADLLDALKVGAAVDTALGSLTPGHLAEDNTTSGTLISTVAIVMEAETGTTPVLHPVYWFR